MADLIKLAIDFLQKKIGAKNLILLAFFCLGVYATTIAKEYVITPAQVDEKVERAGNIIQIQVYELQIQSLTSELYQLKKLKIKKMADEDDLERFAEVKKQLDSIKVQKDSLQKTLYYKQAK